MRPLPRIGRRGTRARTAIALGAGLASAFVATTAFAQTATITTTGVLRRSSTGTQLAPRTVVDGKTPGVSQKDCLDDIVYDLPVVITGIPTNYSLQAWAGTNCADASTRTGTNPTCWPLLPTNISLAAAVNVKIRMQDIVGQMTTNPKNVVYVAATSSVCTSQTTLGSGRTNLNVFLLWINGGDATSQGTGATYAFAVKLFGPDAPTGLAAGAGGDLLKLTWTAPTGQSDLLGSRIYTQAAGGDASAATDATKLVCDEGGVIDGGTDDSGDAISIPVDASCTSVPITTTCGGDIDVTAVTPTEIGGALGGGTVTGLVNGQSYSVAVAGYDSFGNSGALSEVICASPEETVDFWDNYQNSGGTGGGGYCAAGPTGGDTAPWVFFGIGGFVTAVIVRRRRRRG
ncbi:hypothetical protein BH09MYX1_BH09MYX1_28560 [soil metagenome]